MGLTRMINRISEQEIVVDIPGKRLQGFKVYDVNDDFIGTIAEIVIECNQGKEYLLIFGERLKKIRGRDSELLPANEVQTVGQQVHLYKPFSAIKETIQNQHPYGWDSV